MTVKELISKLKEVPEGLEVNLGIGHEFGDTEHVTIESNGRHEMYVMIESTWY